MKTVAESGPQISVIIVTYNSGDDLADCLAAVHEEIAAVQAEVFVVDNDSSDESLAIANEFPRVNVVPNRRNVGFAAAVNQAIARSSGDYLLLLNPDARLGTGALRAMVECLDAHPAAAIVGPRIVDSRGNLVRSCRTFPSVTTLLSQVSGLASRFPTHRVFGSATLTNWDYATERKVDYASGACLLLRRTALAHVGRFDEAYFMYVEEMDLSWRMKEAGWEVWFTPKAVVSHLGGRSAAKVKQTHGFEPLLLDSYYSGQIRFWRRYRGPPGLLIWRILTSATSLVQAARLWCMSFAPGGRGSGDSARVRRALYVARLAWSSSSSAGSAIDVSVSARENRSAGS